LAGVYVKQSGQTSDKLYYAEVDHLGSILRLTDNANKEVFAATYDAWGNRTVTNNTFDFHRGYTGHEHLPEFGLINMNGRMYDPALGRMLSPDAYVQSPLFSQSYNRYSYCVNNPLKFTDPTGMEKGDSDDPINGGELPSPIIPGWRPSGGGGGGAAGWFNPEVGMPFVPTYDYKAAMKGGVMQTPILRGKMPAVISLLHIAPINNPSTLANPYASSTPPPPTTAILMGTMTGQSTTDSSESHYYTDSGAFWIYSGSGLKVLEFGVGAASLTTSILGKDYLYNEIWHATQTRGVSNVFSRARWTNPGAKYWRAVQTEPLEGIRFAEKGLAGVGIGLVVANVAITGEVKPSDWINLAAASISFSGIGSVIAGVWFVADFGTMGYNIIMGNGHEGLGDMLDNSSWGKSHTIKMYNGLY